MYFWKNGRNLWKDRNSLQAQRFIIKSVYLRTTGPGYQTRDGRRADEEAESWSRTWPQRLRHSAHACADESCQSAFTAFLLLQAGGVSPPLIPPGTHRWKLLMASLWRWAWLGYESRTPGGLARRSAERFWLGEDSFGEVTSSRRWQTAEGGGLWRVAMPCYARRTLVSATLRSAEEVFKRPLSCLALVKSTRTWNIVWAAVLTLAWPRCLAGTRWQEPKERERREENRFQMLAQVFKKRCIKKKSQQHNSHQLGQQLVWLQISAINFHFHLPVMLMYIH